MPIHRQYFTDVVYSFTSAVDTTINVNTCGEGGYDDAIYVYEGTMGTLATTLSGDVACNDDFAKILSNYI